MNECAVLGVLSVDHCVYICTLLLWGAGCVVEEAGNLLCTLLLLVMPP